jgi:hypothetical protein
MGTRFYGAAALKYDELEQLRHDLRASILTGDPSDVEEELQSALESLDAQRRESKDTQTVTQSHIFRRSIDMVHRACVQTDHCCLIRRTNKAFLSILGLSRSTRLAGMPLLVFLQKEERQRFTMAFLRFRRRELGYANEMFFQMRPLRPHPLFLAHLSAHTVYGQYGKFLSLVWLFEKSSSD